MAPARETIVAIATPWGEGGLGIVRLSGPRALTISASFFETKTRHLKKAPTHTLHTGWIKNGIGRLDQAVLSLFRAPRSYTGEEVVEISCHGSPGLLQDVVKLCVKAGARLAKPGEFTERAYLNGKMDLIQAEAVADLIHSSSAAARAAAARQLEGQLSRRIKTIREQLLRFAAHVEANLDFVEEDLPPFSRKAMTTELSKIKVALEELLATSVRGRLLREGLRVSIVGRPNVGKSSLFNALLASERAIVTEVPGTTRDVLEEKIEWDGISVVLSDTAGLRETSDVVEQEGVRRSHRSREEADVVLFVVDGSSPISSEDLKIADSLGNRPFIVVLNKSDRPAKFNLSNLPKGTAIVRTSATTGVGLMDLKRTIMAGEKETKKGVATITNLRHINHLEQAKLAILETERAIKTEKSEETVAHSARQALDELGAITGDSSTDDILEAIFRQFCIGK